MTMMQRVRSTVKRTARTVLPPPLFESLQKRYYVWLVSSIGPDREPDLRVARHLVAAGGTAIDIGGGIGVYTRMLSAWVGPGGRVYTLEPFPGTFELLRSNVERLGLDNVELVNAAVSDSEGVVTMGKPHSRSGTETMYRAHIVTDEADTVTDEATGVRATTLDASFADIAAGVSFVKCDVEGHELACLRGGTGFLAATGAAWLIEVSGDPDAANSPAGEVLEIMRRHGYSVWWYDGTTVVERRRGDDSVNYFFLKKEHVAALERAGITAVAGSRGG
jgi:FkbM family methyltransferase